jgi:hypothetical protein
MSTFLLPEYSSKRMPRQPRVNRNTLQKLFNPNAMSITRFSSSKNNTKLIPDAASFYAIALFEIREIILGCFVSCIWLYFHLKIFVKG